MWDVGELAALDQSVDDGGGFSASDASGEVPVGPADGDGPDRSLARVVVQRQSAVL